jgi:ATP synthase protein I
MWAVAARLSAVGLELGVSVAAGYAIGWWLDRRLGTGPYLTVLLLLCGVAAGFRAIWRETRAYRRMVAEGQGGDGRPAPPAATGPPDAPREE